MINSISQIQVHNYIKNKKNYSGNKIQHKVIPNDSTPNFKGIDSAAIFNKKTFIATVASIPIVSNIVANLSPQNKTEISINKAHKEIDKITDSAAKIAKQHGKITQIKNIKAYGNNTKYLVNRLMSKVPKGSTIKLWVSDYTDITAQKNLFLEYMDSKGNRIGGNTSIINIPTKDYDNIFYEELRYYNNMLKDCIAIENEKIEKQKFLKNVLNR